jgi:hypothetical protein
MLQSHITLNWNWEAFASYWWCKELDECLVEWISLTITITRKENWIIKSWKSYNLKCFWITLKWSQLAVEERSYEWRFIWVI